MDAFNFCIMMLTRGRDVVEVAIMAGRRFADDHDELARVINAAYASPKVPDRWSRMRDRVIADRARHEFIGSRKLGMLLNEAKHRLVCRTWQPSMPKPIPTL